MARNLGSNATKLMDEKSILDARSFTHIRVWKVPQPVLGSSHDLKYSLVYVVDGLCLLRYDNERGKGDHYHLGDAEFPYQFESPEALFDDFMIQVQMLRSSP